MDGRDGSPSRPVEESHRDPAIPGSTEEPPRDVVNGRTGSRDPM